MRNESATISQGSAASFLILRVNKRQLAPDVRDLALETMRSLAGLVRKE